MYDRTILFLSFHPSQISTIQSIALPATPVTVESFTSFFSAFSGGYARTQGGMKRESGLILTGPLEAARGTLTPSERLQDGIATYAEALDVLDATPSEMQRTNSLLWIIRGWPDLPLDPRLLAASAPQVVRIAGTINEKRRSEALVVIAKALQN